MEKEFWDNRWQTSQTGWDLGQVSTPLKNYFDQLTDKSLRILIPGCGNAYEAEYLWEQGFHNTFIVEISELAVDSFLKRYPSFPAHHIFITDFFLLNDSFDLIIEQTFFCAIDPARRQEYAKKCADLLVPEGKLVGLLFNRDFESGPPFGGNESEYRKIFSPFFEIQIMNSALNSVQPRAGSELFIKLIKLKK